MSTPPHRIRRLVLEITIPEQDAAWSLQSDLSHLYNQALAAIIDRCLTASSDPAHLQRIESLEVDLGVLRAEYLEQDLSEKLELRLSQALAVRLDEQPEHGIHSDAATSLELVAFFARTGNLPWWADTAPPRLVDQTLGLLLQADAGSLAALLQALASEPLALRRLVNHCGEARLQALFEVAVAAWAPKLVGRSTDVEQLARIGEAAVATTASGWRSAMWSAVLRAASSADRAEAAPVDFWRGVLAHVALDLGLTYTSVITALWEGLPSPRTETDAKEPPQRPDALGEVLWTLLAEVRGEAAHAGAGSRAPSAPGAARLAAVDLWLRVVRRLSALPALPPDWLEQTRQAGRAPLPGRLPAAQPGEAAAADIAAQESIAESDLGQAAELRQGLRLVMEALHELAAAAASPPLSDPEAEANWQRVWRPVRGLQSLSPEVLAQTLYALRATLLGSLPAQAPDSAGRGAAELLLDALSTAIAAAAPSAEESRSSDTANPPVRNRTEPGPPRAAAPSLGLRRVLLRDDDELSAPALPSRPVEALSAPSAPILPAQRAERPEAQVQPPRINLTYGDTEEVYVENAGLVILWPFLGHLFERLELLVDGQFKDPAALHRAVGLLGFLATEDPWPPEYQLTLPKVLCGMAVSELLSFGPPVTQAEAEECTGLLTAVIANAPILREMSIEGFRGTFLFRKGVLSAQGDTWLLRVERLSYDVVLDRFPWGLSWVKQPWMEAALCVEW